jgi:hypothetical protein
MGVAYLVRHIGPAAQNSIDNPFESRSFMPMALATLVLLASSVYLGVQSVRASSLLLFVADAGLFVFTGCAAVAAWSLVSPESGAISLLPTTTSVVTWAGAAVPLGLAGYGLTKAREGFQAENTAKLAEAIVILVLSIGALVAGVRLGVDAMKGREMPEMNMEIDNFRPGVINVE